MKRYSYMLLALAGVFTTVSCDGSLAPGEPSIELNTQPVTTRQY